MLAAGPLVSLLLAAGTGAASPPEWRLARGEVRVVCTMTIGGRFEARTAALAGRVSVVTRRPAAFAGHLTVDLRTLDTGIALRDHHLRGEYLEVDRGEGFAEAVLSNIRLGDADAETVRGRTPFQGSLLLHGRQREVAGQAVIRRSGPAVRVEATFTVALGEFDIASPRYLGVGVRDEVQVIVSLLAEPAAATSGGPP